MADLAFALRVRDDGSAVIEGFADRTQTATKKAARAARTSSSRIAKAFSSVRRVTSRVTGTFGSLAKAATSLRNLFLGGLAAVVVQRAFRAVVGAAAAQEDAVNKLNNALQTAGIFSDKLSASSQQLASSLQLQTRFGDEAILSAQSLLVTYGVTADKLDEATQATLDFAVATGRDLTTAALTLGKAAAGFTGELSRYGIIVKTKGIPQTKIFEAVLAKMNQQFGGRAQADVNTFSGGMAQLSNAFGDLLEALGESITKSVVFRKAIKELSLGFLALSTGLREARGETAKTGDAFGAFIPAAETVITIFSFLERSAAGLKAAFFGLGSIVIAVTGGFVSILDIFGDFKSELDEIATLFDFATDSASENFTVLTDGSEAVKKSREALGRLREELAALETQSRKTKDALEDAFKVPPFLEKFGIKSQDAAFRFKQSLEQIEFSTEERFKNIRRIFADLPRAARLNLLESISQIEGGVDEQTRAFEAGVERIARNLQLRRFEIIPEIKFQEPETEIQAEERIIDQVDRLSQILSGLTDEQRVRVQEQIRLAEGGIEAALAIGEAGAQEEIARQRKKNDTLTGESLKFGQNLLTIGKALGLKTAEGEKALAVTRAIVNTAVGISRAFADLPFPASLGAAATIAASGAAQIATILAAKPGGGGAAPRGPGGGGGGGPPVVPIGAVPAEIEPMAQGRTINITVPGFIGDEGELASRLGDVLEEAGGDGVDLGREMA